MSASARTAAHVIAATDAKGVAAARRARGATKSRPSSNCAPRGDRQRHRPAYVYGIAVGDEHERRAADAFDLEHAARHLPATAPSSIRPTTAEGERRRGARRRGRGPARRPAGRPRRRGRCRRRSEAPAVDRPSVMRRSSTLRERGADGARGVAPGRAGARARAAGRSCSARQEADRDVRVVPVQRLVELPSPEKTTIASTGRPPPPRRARSRDPGRWVKHVTIRCAHAGRARPRRRASR